jgi:hypothetical protein
MRVLASRSMASFAGTGRRKCPVRASVLADRCRAVGSLFVRICVIATATCAGMLLPAQAQRSEPANDIKLYIGLSRGDLNADDEDHVRAFVVLQDHVNYIKDQLSGRATHIRTGDLKFWRYKDWDKVVPPQITHYIVAHPVDMGAEVVAKLVKKPASIIAVEWHVGKFLANDFSANRRPVYAAVLKHRTFISIPGSSEERATLRQLRGDTWERDDDLLQSAANLVRQLHLIFPETRSDHTYFVDCFANQAANLPAWKNVHATIMEYLWRHLHNGEDQDAPVKWRAIWVPPSAAMVENMCKDMEYRKDAQYRYNEANFHVGGSLEPMPMDRKVKARIEIYSHLLDWREQLAIPRIKEQPAEMLTLDEFCLLRAQLRDLGMLTTYIQAHGFKFRQALPLGAWRAWKC